MAHGPTHGSRQPPAATVHGCVSPITHPHKPTHQVQPHSHGWMVSELVSKLRWSVPRVHHSELLSGAPNTFHPSTKRSLLLDTTGYREETAEGLVQANRAARRQRDEASGYPIHSTPAGMLRGT